MINEMIANVPTPLRVAFFTLGCKVNQCDTASMMACFAAGGHEVVNFDGHADCYIINSCTVTAESDRKCRQMTARAHKRNPAAIICITGCLAQRDADAALSLPGVRLVLGNQNRGQIVDLVESLWKDEAEGQVRAVSPWSSEASFEDMPAQQEGKTRATMKIQEGCNRYCTFCIIPYARGPLRSRNIHSIVREGSSLARAGFQEIVLTGIHLASYRGKNGEALMDAVEALATVDGLGRIRLGSLEPLLLTEDFAKRAAACQKLCPQFHLSLQSGSKEVLRRMNRRYTPDEYLHHLSVLRQHLPKAAITTDVIVGFPGESEEEHSESLDFVEKCAFARLHVFPYSPRQGTPAARMPDQIPQNVKQRRTREMIALGESSQKAYQQGFVGNCEPVLFESWNREDGQAEGYTGNYLRVVASAGEDICGCIRPVSLAGSRGDLMEGILI